MPRIYMVRHGRAAANFGQSLDPGLDDLGREQAQAVAQKLAPLGPLPILSSPLARTRETSIPLSKMWDRKPVIEPAVAEVPSPPGSTLESRVAWLGKFMAGTWREVSPDLATWREDCIATVKAIPQDTVVFSHIIAINVLVGAAAGSGKVMLFTPENCSVTIFETDGDTLTLIQKGEEAARTKVN